jgi:pyruvate formate lyase activating enzyme
MYFNIQRFSTHDGDGIRTILFLKGCSLSCTWCQNPESRSDKRSILYDQRLCSESCTECLSVCSHLSKENGQLQINRSIIKESDLIALESTCPTQALSVVGKDIEVDHLYEQLMKDKPFYDQSEGGITFSGGEPLMQPDIVAELGKRVTQKGVSTAIETCMHAPWKNVEAVIPYIDCWLADLKHTNDDKFYKWTKGSLKRIKDNFIRLAPKAKRIVIRIPVVPGFNDTFDELKDLIDFAASLSSCNELHLLPYHTLGMNKYRLLDMPYECSDMPLNNDELLQQAQQYASECTRLNVKIRG